ncbi:cytochrome-c peroxidase [bacterium SCSIO 12741]|nr:cytochrome-c peroxidase [bacterium SCSIO 12741]
MLGILKYRIAVILILGMVLGIAWTLPQRVNPYCFPELEFFPEMPHSSINPVTEEGVELGRYLFYDPILSRDKTFSCGSCHRQEVAFSDAPNALSKGIDGELMKRNTPPLFNLAWHPGLFWDGRAESLESQVWEPVRSHAEMDLDWSTAAERIQASSFYRPLFVQAFGNRPIDSVTIALAIAQFERTLLSNNSKYDRVLRGEDHFTQDEIEGFLNVNDQSMGNCLHCHVTDRHALGTTAEFTNNGLIPGEVASDYTDPGRFTVTGDTTDLGKFKIPTLRNIMVTAPYMHDGRFKTMREVLDFYSEDVHSTSHTDPKMVDAHRGGRHFTEEEKDQIIAFLNTLTDEQLLTNPAFSDPFEKR